VPSCQDAGVLGAVVGVMGTAQAVETLKILLDIGTQMSHRLLTYDALACRFWTLKRVPDPACPLCGPAASITEPVQYGVSCSVA
jgi:adenylyltransferase/sulfurtransferase